MAGLALCAAVKLVQLWVIELRRLATRIKATACGTDSGGQSMTLVGRTAGGWFEWMLMPNWSLKGEAHYW